MLLGAIADDLTGATDLSLILARSGFSVVQTVGVPQAAALPPADAVVVSLKSRTAPADEAVAQSVSAAKILTEAGAKQIFFKYCSTFDSTDEGNIGPVTDALMDMLGTKRTIACPAFPANGRTVYRGHLFVGDLLLSDSPMKDHPLTPMHDSNLVQVLARQTRRPVSLIGLATVRNEVALADALRSLEGIAIVDAIDDGDLLRLGRAARDFPLVTGGSALAMGLPANLGGRSDGTREAFTWPVGPGAVIAGSCSAATLRQISNYVADGAPALALDLASMETGAQSPEAAADFVMQNLAGLSPIVYASAAPAAVADNQRRFGVSGAGERIERFLAELARLLAARGLARFIVAGGETSGAVTAALGVETLRIGPEIDPGVPWTLADGAGKPVALALKSGNFGADDFFAKAWRMLP
jgi:uncharacterized protein YgbK (DUF1537 family)